MSDLDALKEILNASNFTFEESETHASQGGMRTYITVQASLTTDKVVFAFSHEDKLVGIECVPFFQGA